MKRGDCACIYHTVDFLAVYLGGRRVGLMVSALAPERVVRVRALVGDIVLCSLLG